MPALPPSFLFRVVCPIGRFHPPKGGLTLRSSGRLSSLTLPKSLDPVPLPVTASAGWNEDGLFVRVAVSGKSQTPAYDKAEPSNADGAVLLIDTRDTKSIRRAGRFCHQFRVIPGDGQNRDAYVRQEPVAMAREDAKFGPNECAADSKVTKTGYDVVAFISAANLTGFDPEGSPRIGFHLLLNDAEHGVVPMSGDTRLPTEADPSFWSTLELTEE